MMTTIQDADDILEHYGIKGMKWGVRRSDEQLARARGKTPRSEDSSKAKESLGKAKTSGAGTLSNRELQELNKRLNLEKNYADLIRPKTKQSKPLSKEDKEFIAFLIRKSGELLVKEVARRRSTTQVSNSLNQWDVIDLRPKK